MDMENDPDDDRASEGRQIPNGGPEHRGSLFVQWVLILAPWWLSVSIFILVHKLNHSHTNNSMMEWQIQSFVLIWLTQPFLLHTVTNWHVGCHLHLAKMDTNHPHTLKGCLFKNNRQTQYQAGVRSADFRRMSHLCDPLEYVAKPKHRWAGHIVRRRDDTWTKRTLEWLSKEFKRSQWRPLKRSEDVFVEELRQLKG